MLNAEKLVISDDKKGKRFRILYFSFHLSPYYLLQYGSAFEVLLSGMDARDARDKGNERSL